jgi:hypothetical protein
MREKAFSRSVSVLAATAGALLCTSMTYADPPSAAAPVPAAKSANTAPPATVAPAPAPRFPATGMIPVSVHYEMCGFANNDAYHFNPTGNNPNIPRGLVGSGYYGAYSPDSYQHPPCFVDISAAYGTGYGPSMQYGW